MTQPGCWIAEQYWTELAQHISENNIGMLPVAAASKAHGPHLPMNTDYLQMQWLMNSLCETQPLRIWPILGYAYYPAFVNYHGSVSVDESVFMQTVMSVLESMQRAGITRRVIINNGISTIPALQQLVEQQADIQLINVYDGEAYQQASARCIENHDGGHADEEETSIMLALYPELVRKELMAEGMCETKQAGAFTIDDPQAANYCPNGIYGDARLASVEKGLLLTQAILSDVSSQLANI